MCNKQLTSLKVLCTGLYSHAHAHAHAHAHSWILCSASLCYITSRFNLPWNFRARLYYAAASPTHAFLMLHACWELGAYMDKISGYSTIDCFSKNSFFSVISL